ncbi:SDR family NAD(P)-dependent oxidoreductase [Ferviditalea candida]|uniref:SDR family oxidoreductase n=1 Tax=Ferviditalea candida TaxID=3108399 RepID=A0ABU5ZLZ3_9BACL|nr:SDR family oxidoreductase [Paenibacillaceae bacterium T2]
MNQLQDKVCVITGGAGSIGLATAKLFLEEGAKVLLVDLDPKALQQAVDELGSERVGWKAADVTRANEVQAYFKEAVSRWGKVDVIFSNAGNAGQICPITEYPEEVFDRLFAVHVKGAFLNCKYGLPQMNDGGSIIITSSVAAFRGDPGVVAYITAKHAQIGLMRSVSKEAAPRRIRVNTIHPGPVSNDFQMGIEKNLGQILQRDGTQFFNEQIPLGRHASPQEIARSVLYLASDQSSFTTGSTLAVDGGMSV